MVTNLIFLFMFITLTSLSIYLKIKHKDHYLILWVSLLLFCGGLVGLQVLLEKMWMPFIAEQGVSSALFNISMVTTSFLNLIINTFPFYAVLVIFIIYSGFHSHLNKILILLSLPLWISLFFQTNLLENNINLDYIIIWGLTYVIASIGLVIRLMVNASTAKQRLNHGAVGLVFILPIIALNAYHISSQPFSEHLLILVSLICIISTFIILTLYLKNSFLGVQSKSIQIVDVGTGLIHHTLKNSIGKIKLNALTIRKNVSLEKYEDLDIYIDNLLKTHESMLEMMENISNSMSNKLELTREKVDISQILDKIIEFMDDYPDIQVTKDYAPTMLFIDRMHITECLENIFNNAVDAMKEAGKLHVSLESRNNKVLLTIKDDGCGMSNIQLQNVFEPFYTTNSKSGKHFGLGLYQVKKVMRGHKGKVDIKSKLDSGTSVVLTFKKMS